MIVFLINILLFFVPHISMKIRILFQIIHVSDILSWVTQELACGFLEVFSTGKY